MTDSALGGGHALEHRALGGECRGYRPQRHPRSTLAERPTVLAHRFAHLEALLVLVVATIAGYFLRDLKATFIDIQKYWSIAVSRRRWRSS